jgi:Ca-activated chloride channel family protein
LLESTPGSDKSKIKDAINKLGSGGSTGGEAGIRKAYDIASSNFIQGGNNRIILGTDGDFNVGVSSQDELIKLIEEKRDSRIYLTVLGVGRGNLNDAMMEQLADHGNGTYEYIDNEKQMEKVFIHDYTKFYTVAKDVKVQVKFNPEMVESYRLIGYENRMLSQEDFTDDKKDAGELGANQNVTAIYEIVPVGNANYKSAPTFTIDFRYKRPDSDVSVPTYLSIFDEGKEFDNSSDFMRFTAGVAAFSMVLTNSEFKGTANYNDILTWLSTTGSLRDDRGYKAEFKGLVEKVRGM